MALIRNRLKPMYSLSTRMPNHRSPSGGEEMSGAADADTAVIRKKKKGDQGRPAAEQVKHVRYHANSCSEKFKS